jgi:hypothetical protein
MLDLRSIARAEASLFGSQDVASVIALLQDAAGIALETGIISLQTTADIVATSSELVGSTEGASFAAGEALRSNSSSSATLGRSLEQISAVLAVSLPTNLSAVVVTDTSVAMAVLTVSEPGAITFPDRHYGHGLSVCSEQHGSSGGIESNCTATGGDSSGDTDGSILSGAGAPSVRLELSDTGVRAIAYVFYTSGRAFQQEGVPDVDRDGNNSTANTEEAGSIRVNSGVVSVQTVGAGAGGPTRITFSLSVRQPGLQTEDQALCSFWRFTEGTDDAETTGDWSQDGCRELQTERGANRTVCECDHLTNFAVLAGASSAASGSPSQRLASAALDALTYVGLGVSVPCLLLVVAAYLLVPSARTQKKVVLMYISACLALALLCFVGGLLTTSRGSGCTILAVLLHFFLVSAFGWMLVQGLLTYQHFVEIFGRARLEYNMLKVTLVVFSVALLIVAATFGVLGQGVYGTKEACWLSGDDGAIWAFLGPMAVVALINVGIIVRASIELRRNRLQQEATGQTKKSTARDNARRILINNASLLSVLGGTWLLGAAVIATGGNIVTAYAFTLCNVFQGVCILYFQVYRDKMLWEKLGLRRKQRGVKYRVKRRSTAPLAAKSGLHSTGKASADGMVTIGPTSMIKARSGSSSAAKELSGTDAEPATELTAFGFTSVGVTEDEHANRSGLAFEEDDRLSAYGFA